MHRLESFLGSEGHSEARELVENAYTTITAALLRALPLYMKGTAPTPTVSTPTWDKAGLDEKELRNANIMVAENCHHLFSSLHGLKVACLEPFIKDARLLYDQYLAAYVQWSAKGAAGKLGEFFEGVDRLLVSKKDEEVAFQLAFNKQALSKAVGQNAGKDVRFEKTLSLFLLTRACASCSLKRRSSWRTRGLPSTFRRKRACFRSCGIMCRTS